MVFGTGPPATEDERSKSCSLRLAEGVILVTGENVARLLDFGRGRFYGLDEVSGLILSECLRFGPDAALARVRAEYKVAETRARRDIYELLDNLRRKRLLAPVDGRPFPLIPPAVRVANSIAWLLRQTDALTRWALPNRAQPRPGTEKRAMAWLLALSWISIRVLGWSASVALFRGLPRRGSDIPPAERAAIIAMVDRDIQRAGAATLLLPAACKERALAAQSILKRWYGLPARIVVGVRRHPFLAHAWVECDGRVVTDDPDRCEPFTPVLYVDAEASAEPERSPWQRQASR